MRKRKIVKSDFRYEAVTSQAMDCQECGHIVENVGTHIKSVTCSRCVAKMVDPPNVGKPKASDEKRPRGWQFRNRYVSPSGKVYHRGREVNESNASVGSAKRNNRDKAAKTRSTKKNPKAETSSTKGKRRRKRTK